ncbi:MAG: type II secretion system protein N, partial [Brevundimonas sp.]
LAGVLGRALASQLGRAVWIGATPPAGAAAPATAPAAPVDVEVFRRIDAFFRSGAGAALGPSDAEAGRLRLYGVRAGGVDGGSAILALPDGSQRSVLVGEAAMPGLILESVSADGVSLSRGGAITRLGFSDAPPGAPPPPAVVEVMAPTPVARAAPVIDPAALAAQAGLRPRLRGARIDGFIVQTRGDGAAVRAAGLQAGDVLLAVKGVELTGTARVAQLRQRLADAPSAEIRFERAGAVRTVTVRTRP